MTTESHPSESDLEPPREESSLGSSLVAGTPGPRAEGSPWLDVPEYTPQITAQGLSGLGLQRPLSPPWVPASTGASSPWPQEKPHALLVLSPFVNAFCPCPSRSGLH